MNRRHILKGLPAAIAVSASPAAALVAGNVNEAVALCFADPAETPVAALFREWQAAFEAEKVAFSESDTGECAMCQAATERRMAVEKRLMTAPCSGTGDWALKVMAWTCFGDFSISDSHEGHDLWAEARAFVA